MAQLGDIWLVRFWNPVRQMSWTQKIHEKTFGFIRPIPNFKR